MRTIDFKKNNYDPQIDYIKGLCILFVIWTHSMSRNELGYILFPYWGDTAVPIFLIIQVFHYYKKGVDLRRPSLLKLWRRILLPFIIMIALMFIVQYFIYYDATNGTFSPTLYWDKRGFGSYYIFIYLEFAFIIPLFSLLFKRLSAKWSCIVFVILSQLLEYYSCITHCPENIYRILFFRYTFLIMIGFLLATKRLEVNKYTLCVGVIGIISLYLFNYTNIYWEPLFYTSSNWKYCHWICYLYIAYIFLWFLKASYYHLNLNNLFRNYLVIIGKNSYEIYLFQMFYYATIGIYVKDVLSFLGDYPVDLILFIAITTITCVVPVIVIKEFVPKLVKECL